MIQLKQVIQALAPQGISLEILKKIPASIAETNLNGTAIDSRHLVPGSLFVALSGERTDGHRYVASAFKNQALAALVDQDSPGGQMVDLRNGHISALDNDLALPLCLRVDNTLTALQQLAAWWQKTLDLRVIGITGSVGKSSTKELVASVLAQKYRTLKNRGNFNNEIGLPLTLLEAGLGQERAVLEMGFYVPGEIRLLCEIAHPMIGIVTNIGTVHAERAGSQEVIANGKAELIESLPNNGTAILNMDDAWVHGMAARTQANVFYYGITAHAHLWASNIHGLGLDGLSLTLHYQGEEHSMTLPFIGRHSIHTILRAVSVGLVEQLDWQMIENGLRQPQSQLRMSVTRASNGALILDDTYNAAPESTIAALDLLAEVSHPDVPDASSPRRVAVLGEMYELGPYERQGHQQVGRHAVQCCDVLIAVGDRSKIIAEAALHAGMDPQQIHWLPTVQEAIPFLRSTIHEKDVLLIKGSHGLRMDRITWALETSA